MWKLSKRVLSISDTTSVPDTTPWHWVHLFSFVCVFLWLCTYRILSVIVKWSLKSDESNFLVCKGKSRQPKEISLAAWDSFSEKKAGTVKRNGRRRNRKQEWQWATLGKFSFSLVVLLLWKISVPKIHTVSTWTPSIVLPMHNVRLQTTEERPNTTYLSTSLRKHQSALLHSWDDLQAGSATFLLRCGLGLLQQKWPPHCKWRFSKFQILDLKENRHDVWCSLTRDFPAEFLHCQNQGYMKIGTQHQESLNTLSKTMHLN